MRQCVPCQRLAKAHDSRYLDGVRYPAPDALLDALGCVAFECDGEGKFTFLNPLWEQLTGYRVEDCLGRRYLEFAPPDRAREYGKRFLEAATERRALMAYESECLTKDGRRLWVESRATLEFDANGKLFRLRGTLIDINARRALQDKERDRERDARLLLECSAELQRAESFQQIVDTVATLMWQRLRCGTTVLYSVDVAADRMTLEGVAGTHAETTREHLGVLPYSKDPIIQEMQRSRVPALVLDASSDERVHTRFAESGLRIMFGAPLWSVDQQLGLLGTGAFEGEPTPEFGPLEMEFMAGLGVHVSMATSRIRLLAERERQRQRDQELERRLSESRRLESLGMLAGGIAHDFNNVLVGVLGNASLVRDTLGPNHAMHEALADICLSAKRAARLAGRMLTYSGGKPIQRGAVPLANLIAETITIVTAGVSKSTTFIVDDVDADLAVRGSAVELQQVLLNLLTNASESARDAAVRVQVSATSAELDAAFLAGCIGSQLEPGRYAVLCVEDNGAGIDPEIRPMMFDPFASTRGTGHGFGLASALGIARAHAGALHVSDATPSGTRICVILPLSADKNSSQSGEMPAQSSGVDPPIGRVALVVDDEAMVRAFLRRALELQQFRVLEAVDGEDALQQLAAHRLDLVVLDLTMPKRSGKEVLVQLRAEQPQLPVILASGYTVSDAVADADPHTRILQKPYALASLLTTIGELFAVSKATAPGTA